MASIAYCTLCGMLVRAFSLDVGHQGARLLWLALSGVPIVVGLVSMAAVVKLGGTSPGLRLRFFRVTALVSSLGLSLLVAEITFMYISRSHGVGYSLAARTWFKIHWKVNRAGFRERELDASLLAKKKKVVIIGDSFVAGHGIEDPEDRFSNQLEKRLPADWVVLNYGRNGADTRHELSILQEVPFEPDVIVLAYFGNDIREVANEAGYSADVITPYVGLPPWLKDLIRRSYLLDFIYWAIPRDDLQSWWSYYDTVYRNPALQQMHAQDLAAFADHANKNSARLIVVLFPYLHDLPASEVYRPLVKQVFEQQSVPVLDVLPLVRDIPPEARIVNSNDVHPSILVHRLVAERLASLVLQETGRPPAH